ncbi:16S rRNA (cytosine(1402)-N(4))-methyltransferase RsmH [Cryomorphaceae bacterium 1068]|nr:16S rRNA (cytosine(1402)-N(4))-methyltransferase RsmH [Cryomorphaceae bacterium 1068]
MSSSGYHEPVLLRESVDALIEDMNGVYVDVTFGGGGHSREVLSRLGDKGKLIAFDRDEDAQSNVINDPRFTLVPSDFRFMQNHLRFAGYRKVDGILADLGVSSHQFDVPERGFSIRTEGKLDMRMGKTTELTAAKVVNKYDEAELMRVLKNYGELSNARQLASIIVARRNERKFETTEDLVQAIEKVFPPQKRMQNLAKVFQGIRIEVNDEMGSLEALLKQSVEVLKPKGNLVVISYHSLEDRPVKRFMRAGDLDGEVKKDFFGNPERPFTPQPGKPITPSKEEIEKNSRARSAKLRVAKRNE